LRLWQNGLLATFDGPALLYLLEAITANDAKGRISFATSALSRAIYGHN